MKIDRKHALQLWQRDYGNAQTAADFAGREMIRDNYGKRNSEGGWNIHHILHQSKGGKSEKENLLCANIKTNEEAGEDTTFWTNGRKFQVKKIKGTGKYELKEKKFEPNNNAAAYMQNVNGGIVN